MCDTLIATKLATSNGIAIFGKNSDRPPNEAQHIVYFPAVNYAANSRVKCTYIEIPQAEKTYAVLLSKPYWMWGAEMGVNEHGLVIGNEAVYSKIPANKEPALLGMDMLRIALERAVTPREAVQVIVDLLDQFGQGGNCVAEGEAPVYYHNSFIIANADDAWVLETVDKQWAARQIKDVYSISNCLTLGNQWDMASPKLVDLAVQKGFSKSAAQFDYAKDYSDFLVTTFAKGRTRRATTTSLLEQQKGTFNVQSMMGTLRHHDDEHFDPQSANLMSVDVCMHAGFGPIHISQSTASMVVYLDGDSPIIFATGTSAPCTSIFKPMWVGASIPLGPVPTSQADSASLFWSHERLHRSTLLNYPERIKTYAADRDELEAKFTQGALNLTKASANERAEFSAECFRESAQAEADWLKRVEQVPARKNILYASAWNGLNKKVGILGGV
jgi:secernin